MTVPRFFRLNSNNALIEFLLEGTPEIREHYLDSKKDVDRHLKSACEQFIQQQTKLFVEQLEEFLTKVQQNPSILERRPQFLQQIFTECGILQFEELLCVFPNCTDV